MLVKILKDFKFAEKGIHVKEYLEGQEVEVSAECAEAALAEGWVECFSSPPQVNDDDNGGDDDSGDDNGEGDIPSEPKKRGRKAKTAAPENK